MKIIDFKQEHNTYTAGDWFTPGGGRASYRHG